MQIASIGKVIAYATDARTTRDIYRVAIPGFEVSVTASPAGALAAVQAAGPVATVLLAEYSASASAGEDESAAVSRQPAAVLLAAARIRCPHVRRVMLVPADLLPWMIRMIHAGTADTLVALPIESHELISAVLPAERGVGSHDGQVAGA